MSFTNVISMVFCRYEYYQFIPKKMKRFILYQDHKAGISVTFSRKLRDTIYYSKVVCSKLMYNQLALFPSFTEIQKHSNWLSPVLVVITPNKQINSIWFHVSLRIFIMITKCHVISDLNRNGKENIF